MAELEAWLAQTVPCILFLRTGELPYWQLDTPHAVVLLAWRQTGHTSSIRQLKRRLLLCRRPICCSHGLTLSIPTRCYPHPTEPICWKLRLN